MSKVHFEIVSSPLNQVIKMAGLRISNAIGQGSGTVRLAPSATVINILGQSL